MDSIFLHPQAQAFLFTNYRALRLIFNDVLGHLEVDYISMALINPKQTLLYISSQPSIEQNLIEHNLWNNDPGLQCKNNNQDKIIIWNDIYKKNTFSRLWHFKLEKPKLKFVLSKPITHKDYRIIYSFGVKTDDPSIHANLLQDIDTLVSMGKFCLQNILKEVHIDFPKDYFVRENHHLKLVKNYYLED